MLTFFEYLRQRAFESVLAGAQEALEFLESQQALDGAKQAIPQLSQPATDDPGLASPAHVVDKSDKATAESNDDSIRAPRDRGRPKNRSKESR